VVAKAPDWRYVAKSIIVVEAEMPFDSMEFNRDAAADLIEAGMRRIENKRNWCRDMLFHARRGLFSGYMQYCAIGSVTAEPYGGDYATVARRHHDLNLALAAMNEAAWRRGYDAGGGTVPSRSVTGRYRPRRRAFMASATVA
jgi:hypothetical protein